MVADLVRQFVQVLLMGETLSLRSTLGEQGVVHDPTLGRVEPDGLTELAALWRNRGSARDPEWVAITSATARSVAEFRITLDSMPGSRLSVAVVADRTQDAISDVRIFHRRLDADDTSTEHERSDECHHNGHDIPEPVARHERFLASGDLDGILSCFSADAVATSDAGGDQTFTGLDGLRTLYAARLSGGAIDHVPCSVTSDGARCALEYLVGGGAGSSRTVHSSLSVFELDDEGLIRAVRTYADSRS